MTRPLSRAERRAEDRRTRRELRSLGCTCRPRLLPPDGVEAPPGAVYGVLVAHERGCRFGDSVLELNEAGLMPTIVGSSGRPGCQR